MKVLFLDIDGVLNSEDWVERTKKSGEITVSLTRDLDRDAVSVLNSIITQSGAKVVISSSWRVFHDLWEMKSILQRHGFVGEVIDMTPRRAPNPPYRRGNEIQAWLDQHPEVKSFVIIDDDADMEHLLDKLVRTDWMYGLREEHVAPALKVLG